MLEPPSSSLLKSLSSLKLCSPRDLRRCRGYVRRLTRDLPAFDSIWIDALVQSRRLTAFQGQSLEASQGERLQVGPCLLLERLGGTATAETFLARRRDADDVCVLKLTAAAPEQIRPQSEHLAKLVSVATDFAHPAIVLPQATQVVEWPSAGDLRLVSISRHVRGPHLAELLVRRGRFPTSVVVEIGRQLLDGLAALEARGLVHGDLLLTNVRITPQGQSVLVDAGLVSVFRPEFSFHTIRSADRYDGLAPERISAGLPPSNSSDLYALGCLLWHLLAGRPPFAAGDPLAKVAAHQTQTIVDVREWVPDTPDWLAKSLLRWTATNPAARPRSLREAAADFGRPTRGGRRRLASFRGEFDRSTPRKPPTESNSRWPLTVAAIFMMSGAALSLLDQGARNFVLSLTRPRAEVTTRETHRQPTWRAGDVNPPSFSSNLAREPQPLPAPNVSGRIVLAPGGRYLAEDISGSGSLQIVGDPTHPAEIVIADRALSLWAERIRLSHVRFTRQPSATNLSSSMLIADCQQLEVHQSRFDQIGDDSTQKHRRGAALAWRPQESRSRRETQVVLRDVVFTGVTPAVYLNSLPNRFTAENVLKVGHGDFVQLSDPGAADWICELRRVTLRGTGPLLRCWTTQESAPLSRVNLSATSCVFDLDRSVSEVTRPALIAWMTGRLPSNWRSAIDWQLEGILVPPDIDVITRIDPSTGRRTSVDESQFNIDGLVAAQFEFSGPPALRPEDSALRSSDAPRGSASVPGIDADLLPQAP